MKPRTSKYHSCRHSSTILTATAIFTLLIPYIFTNQVQAYFQSSAPEVSAGRATVHLPEQTDANAFVININQTQKRTESPLAKYSLPALDTLPTNTPVYNALHGNIVKEESLEATLYANIKLRKTITDYLLIQEKAKELLKDIRPDKFQWEAIQETTFISQDFMKFQQLLTTITDEFHGTTQQSSSAIKKEHPAAPESSLSISNLTPVAQAIPQTQQQLSPNSYIKALIVSSGYANRNQNPRVSTNPTTSSKRSNSFEQEITLPWIIRMPLNIFQYLMSHGVEALIYGAIALMIISIISAMRAGK